MQLLPPVMQDLLPEKLTRSRKKPPCRNKQAKVK
jgi:hypothetical protein